MFMDFYRCEANIPKGTGFSGNSFSPPPRFQSSRAFRNWALLQEQPGYLHDCFDCCCDHLLLQFLVVVDGKHHHHLRSPHQGFQVKGFQPYIYIYIVWHMLNQCRTFATVRLEMTSESKLLQLKTHGKSPRFSVGWCARSKALKSTGHRVVRIYQSPIAHHYKIVSDAILLPFKDQLPFTLYQYSYVFFIYIYIDIESAPLPAQQNCLTSKPSQRQTIIWNRCECTTTQPSPWRELAGTGGRRRPRWTSASWAQQKLRFSIDILHDLLCLLYF